MAKQKTLGIESKIPSDAHVILEMIQYNEKEYAMQADLPVDELLTQFKKDHINWINIDGLHERSIVIKLGKYFSLHSLLIEDILSDHQPKAEEFAWFYLLTEGKNGLEEKRIVDITPLDYFQFRIMGADTRFQRNDYLFFALSMYESLRVSSNVAVCGKKIKQNYEAVDSIHLYIKNICSSGAYWNSALNELLAMIRCLGPPHYLVH